MRRIVVTGASGQVGVAFAKLIPEMIPLTRADLDLAKLETIESTLAGLRPDLLINCAAYTAVDAAEADEEAAYTVNAGAVEAMAAWCAAHNVRFATFSTDYVFDGTSDRPYVESDPIDPINAYGRTKAAGERLALAVNPDSLVVRTSWVISVTRRNFLTVVLERARQGTLEVVDDQYGRPTIADDLAGGTVHALEAGATGILHLTNQGTTTWYGLASKAIELVGLDHHLARPTTSDRFPRPAPRPRWSVLGSTRMEELGIDLLPPWEESLAGVLAADQG